MTEKKKKIGVIDGKFQECPQTPNCVSTQSKGKRHGIDPINYEGSREEAKDKILKIINSLKRTTIVSITENYIHAEFKTGLFKFIDDVEFYIPEDDKIIHFRSASRVGKSDLGTNRRRMEKIRQLYNI